MEIITNAITSGNSEGETMDKKFVNYVVVPNADNKIATGRVRIADIHISQAFANTTPAKEKMEACRDYWTKFHHQDRFLVLNHDNILIDGYVQYLILQENGEEEAEVIFSEIPGYKRQNHNFRNHCRGKIIADKDGNGGNGDGKRKATTYIYGRHITGYMPGKEYIWRIPGSWTDFADNVRIGDDILCPTRYGIMHVIVTRIKKIDGNGCPPRKRIKRVASKKIWRNSIAA